MSIVLKPLDFEQTPFKGFSILIVDVPKLDFECVRSQILCFPFINLALKNGNGNHIPTKLCEIYKSKRNNFYFFNCDLYEEAVNFEPHFNYDTFTVTSMQYVIFSS